MSLTKIRAALETHLNAMQPPLMTTWQNVPFDPVAGVPYQSVHLLYADPQNPTLGDGHYREVGFMQIMLCYPIGDGSADIESRIEDIKATFKRGVTLENAGLAVTISRTPASSPAIVNADRYCVPVRVPYYADVLVS